MPLLPAPTTRSPGKLELLYQTGLLQHRVGTNFNATVDITVIPPIRTEAVALAAVVGPCIPNTCQINSWRIVNPGGITLYEEAFATPIIGTYVLPTAAIQSESATFSLTGKGAPPVGEKQGQIRYELFGNFYDPNIWTNPTAALATHTGLSALRNFLNSSTLTGCDFYGSPGVWRNYYTLQINAHYQKRYGS